ncbi:serine/threonine protein kinase, partial [Myxococcota bacterium]|nr:serine/threonine protein kinase [Myxococcota bacterium]
MTTGTSGGHSGAQLSVRMITGLPTPLARGLRLASSRIGSDAERFAARLAFLDGALHFLVAAQDAERALLDLPRPQKLVELLDRMERATLGMWAEAARALARALAEVADRPLPAVGAGLLAEGRSVDLLDGVEALIRLRNQVAHGADLGALAPEQARRALEESDGPFRSLVRGLEPLCDLRLVVEVDGHERHDERWAARLVVHRGEEPTVHEIVVDEHALPTRQPVFLADDGRVVRAVPWMMAEQSGNVRRVVLLDRWREGGPTWSEPGGPSTRAEWLDAEGYAPGDEDPRSWFDKLQQSRRRRCLPVAVVRGLQPSMEVERPPWVRQCRPLRLLGRGGTGAVWLVEDQEREHAKLALKVLHPALASNREHVERMRNEFEALRRLQVPGVVQVIDVWHDEIEGPCLLMEWVEGRSLAQVTREGPLPTAQAVDIVSSLLRTLAIAHERSIIHRDLKPSNVILTAGGPRLIDFGVARLVDGATLTATADIVGTLAYAAPEQLRGEKAGPGADLYGAGRILQELLTGASAADGAMDALPAGLQRVIRRALRPEPHARFSSALEMVAALEEAQAGGGVGCALDAGEPLGGGLVVVGVGEEIVDGIYLVHARTRTGEEAALLAPRPEGAAREAFRRRIADADPGRRAASGCLGTRTTEDGVPYVELRADDAWRRARALLGLPDFVPVEPSPGAPSPGAPSPGAPSPGAPSPSAPSPAASPPSS